MAYSVTEQVTLSQLLPDVVAAQYADVVVGRLCLDSRDLRSGDCFVALPGARVDGRAFIDVAIAQGATLVLSESDSTAVDFETRQGCLIVSVPDLRGQLSEVAGRYFNQPSKAVTLVGITGTNGKTSCSQWLAQLLGGLNDAGRGAVASIGTLGYGRVGEELNYTGMTTPDAIQFQEILGDFVAADVKAVVAEVSSHSLVLGRVSALEFDVAVMTNISRDHMDFHGDEASYVAAKCELMKFASLKKVVLNRDDAYFDEFASACHSDIITTSLLDPAADFYARELAYHAQGITAQLCTPEGEFPVRIPLWGDFNLHNVLSVTAAAYACGYEVEDIVVRLADLQPVSGRLETVTVASDISVVVDFAHTPDALSAALKALRKHASGKIWCLFGCGGDRDQGKRPMMAALAEALADQVLVTSDNPRSEDPLAIIEEIRQGFTTEQRVSVMVDRAQAIETVITQAGAGDIVLLAGKGHENYQIVGDNKLPFSDFACARLALRKRMEAQP
ncbi:MAG: UDP-N-acetylmuramoyl-L-alanyl-D-glutamate--2,6-diaminopimelate ligase [Candidatus Pelagadaptatus aseana]|uniref:UDP-N-acetylmuramoyl-L-alanyl-D-glutamate--2, 6-diaminopimelate ligase n=1 Tax=Candidatus Pelagadaptatus aseana TaxID=3120508 RepID=UPI0039B2EFA1